MGSGYEGTAADGRIRVELDGDGRLADLNLDPRVTHLPVDELRVALIDAFTRAQDQLYDEVSEAASAYKTDLLLMKAEATLLLVKAEATEIADRRFAEISTALYDLSRRAGRQW
ncbi:YbaB/EbfC family nucleoid-associated protein [Actinoplanes sp. GCM10030250]|uniref:YbaB/EbfC family nucleoid-associated protein n=1 Tax=Actinoplanes sp. GCM10030250 TaxID=3273376 RepID=UPI00360F25EE